MSGVTRTALAVKGFRCFLGFHRWRLRSVCNRTYIGGTKYWEVYEDCGRCGETRSYDERNQRVADALRNEVDARWRAASEGDTRP